MKKPIHPILVGKTKSTVNKLTNKSNGIPKTKLDSTPDPKKPSNDSTMTKEIKAAKKKNRRENIQLALGGLAATAGTVLAGIRRDKKILKDRGY